MICQQEKMSDKEALQYFIDNQYTTSIAKVIDMCVDNKAKDSFWKLVMAYKRQMNSGVRLI